MDKPPGGRIGLWGIFDAEKVGDVLLWRVVRRELSTRLPACRVEVATARQALRPSPRDGGDELVPLTADSIRERAAALDGLVVVGADLLAAPNRWFLDAGDLLPDGAPVIWHRVTLRRDPTPELVQPLRAAAARCTHISAGDEDSRRRLGEAGVEANVVGDPCVLAPRLFSPDLLAKRLEYLWLMRWYPSDGAVALIDGDASLLADAPTTAADLTSVLASQPDLRIVIAETGSVEDSGFADALADRLPQERLQRLPRCAGLEDLAAAIAHSAIVATSSARTALVAQSYARSTLVLHPGEPVDGAFLRALRAGPPSQQVASRTAEADAELDRIAEINAEAVRRSRSPKEETMFDHDRLAETEQALDRLQTAHEARSRRLATERMVFANHLHKAEGDIAALKAEVARLGEQLANAEARLAQAEAASRAEAAARSGVEAELAALRATRTFRYTAELRSVYARLRRLTDGEEAAPGA